MNILKAITGAVETGVGIMTGNPLVAAGGAQTFLGGLMQPNGAAAAASGPSPDIISSIIGDQGANATSVNALGSLAGTLTTSPDALSSVTQLALA